MIKKIVFMIFLIFLFFFGCSSYNSTEKDSNMEKEIQKKMTLALKQQEKENYEGAILNFEEIIKLKDTPECRVCLGSAKLINCDFYGAINEFEIALKNRNKLNLDFKCDSLLGIIYAYIMTDQYKKAYKTSKYLFKEIDISTLSIDKQIDYFINIAKSEMNIGLHNEAINHFKKALSIEERGYLYVGLARALASSGNLKDALKSCQKAVELEDSGRTRFGLGEIKEKIGDLRGALEEYKLALVRKKYTSTYGMSKSQRIAEKERIERKISNIQNKLKNKK